MIVKEGNKWILYNKDKTKKLSEHPTQEEAKKREHQVNFFKALKTHPELRKQPRK